MARHIIAVLLLLAVFSTARADAADPPATVALDFSGLNDRQYAALDGLELEKHLVLRLIQEGFAVVTRQAQSDLLIRVEVHQNAVSLRASRAGHPEVRNVDWDRRTELDLLHLELSQKVVELARSALAVPPRTAAPPATHAPTPPPGASSAPQRPTASPPASDATIPPIAPPTAQSLSSLSRDILDSTLSIRVGGGAALRPPFVDPTARLDVGLWIGGSWRAELGIGVIPSSGAGVGVIETTPTVGIGAELPLGAHWRLGAAARAGVLLHGYALSDSSASPTTGLAVDGVFALPVHISKQVISSIWLDLAIALGATTRGRRHLLDGQSLWHRVPAHLEMTLGVAIEP